MTLETMQHAIHHWYEMQNNVDMNILNELLADDVLFRSPVTFQPYPSKPVIYFILTNVIQVFENFTYHCEIFIEGGNNVVLEFSAHVGDKKRKGIDMIQFDENGKTVNFEVMISAKSRL
jgi:hypothetical protein